MNRRLFSLIFSAATILAACDPTGSPKEQAARAIVPPGKALVVFYRPSAFAGGAIRFPVNHADGLVGQLGSGTVLFKAVEPGPQTFWAQVVSEDTITVTPREGQTVYVRGDVRMGVYAGRPSFTQVSAEQAERELD